MLSSFILIIFLAALVQIDCKKRNIDLVTFATAMAIPYFGVWPIIVLSSKFHVPPSEYSTIIVNFIVIISYLFLWGINKWIKKISSFSSYKKFVELDQFIVKMQHIKLRYIIYLWVFMLLFTAYGYMAFGTLRVIDIAGFSSGEVNLPFWYLVIFSSKKIFIVAIIAALSIKKLSGSKYKYIININLILVIIMSLLYGKASIVSSLFLYFIFLLKIKQKDILNFRTIFSSILAVLFLVVCFNFFQHIRSALLSPNVYSKGESAATIFEQRLQSLETADLVELDKVGGFMLERPSVWKFNEMIYRWQFVDPTFASIPFGKLLVSSWIGMVPRTIWKDKPVNNLQREALYPFYGKTFSLFQAPSLLGYVFADFSLLCLFVFPFMMICLLMLSAYISLLFNYFSVSALFITSGAILNMLGTEANYDSYVLILRNSLFLALVWSVVGILPRKSRQ